MTPAALVAAALAEDMDDRGDVTSRLAVPAALRARGRIVARATGVLAGREVAQEVARQTGVQIDWERSDGDPVAADEAVAEIAGLARAVLGAERTLLNVLSRLSGVATLTRVYVDACAPVPVLDTRKTTPGWRALEKAAVVAGGGRNHRMGLSDAVLVKDNHLAVAGARLADIVAAARRELPDATVEVEADDLGGVRAAIAAGADWVLLDNMSPRQMRAAVRLADGRIRLEASGRMTVARAATAARCGVDAVSVGALTHSAPALDLGLDFAPPTA